MENRRNYYRILHVQRDAPQEIIRISYRTLMQTLRMHPDLGGDHGNASLINEAYAVLSNPQKRAAYDRTLRSAREEAQGFTAAQGSTSPTDNEAAGATADAAATTGRREAASPRKRSRPGMRERAVARLRKQLPVTVLAGGMTPPALEAHTVDISPAGLRFLSRVRLPVGKLVRVECDLCSTVAEVRNCTPAPGAGLFAVGLRFRDPEFRRRSGSFIYVAA